MAETSAFIVKRIQNDEVKVLPVELALGMRQFVGRLEGKSYEYLAFALCLSQGGWPVLRPGREGAK